MTMTVKTQNGTQFMFTQKDGKTFFQKGLLSGEVIRINPITIGEVIDMDFYKDHIYGGIEEHSMYLRSSPVAEISVKLI